MNLNNLTIKSQQAVQAAQDLATNKGHQAIETAHLLKGLITTDDNVIPFLLGKSGINVNVLSQAADAMLTRFAKVSGGEQYMSNQASKALQKATDYAREMGDDYISVEHLLLGLLATGDQVSDMLKQSGLNEKDLKVAIQELRKGSKVNSASSDDSFNALNRKI